MNFLRVVLSKRTETGTVVTSILEMPLRDVTPKAVALDLRKAARWLEQEMKYDASLVVHSIHAVS